jgi:hypothetical protein
MCQESLPATAPKRQKRQRKFQADCEKMFFKGYNHNRMFSQGARAYILAYHMIRQEQLTDSASTTTDLNSAVSPVKVEKMLKTFKTHRCAMDFDSAFCRAVFNGENSSGASVSL